MKHYTSIEQSKKLLSLGLDPESADMWYNYHRDEWDKVRLTREIPSLMMTSIDDIPCWSVGALLEVMPIIEGYDTAFEDEDAKGICTTYYKQLHYCATGNYECIYKEDWEGGSILKRFKATSSIEVIYDMMVYLLENNYLNKK